MGAGTRPAGGNGGGGPADEPEEPEEPTRPLAFSALSEIDVDTAPALEVFEAITGGVVFDDADRPEDPAELAARLQRARQAVRLWQALTQHCLALLTAPISASTDCLSRLAAEGAPTTLVQADSRTWVISLLTRLWKQHGPP